MRRVAIVFVFSAIACAHSEPAAEAPAGRFEMQTCSPEESSPALPTTARIAVVALCIERDPEPLVPVFYLQEGGCAQMEVEVGSRADTIQVRVSESEGSSRLAVSHVRDGQLVSDGEMPIETGVVTRIGERGPVARLELFSSRDEFLEWARAGAAALEASGCVAG